MHLTRPGLFLTNISEAHFFKKQNDKKILFSVLTQIAKNFSSKILEYYYLANCFDCFF